MRLTHGTFLTLNRIYDNKPHCVIVIVLLLYREWNLCINDVQCLSTFILCEKNVRKTYDVFFLSHRQIKYKMKYKMKKNSWPSWRIHTFCVTFQWNAMYIKRFLDSQHSILTGTSPPEMKLLYILFLETDESFGSFGYRSLLINY